MQQDDHRHADDAGDRGDVADEVELQIIVERGVDRVRHGGEQQRVAVGRGADHGLGADIAAGAGAVFDHEGLPEPLVEPLADQPRRDVDAAAGGKTGNDAHRPGRVILRRGGMRKRRRGEAGGRELQELSAMNLT